MQPQVIRIVLVGFGALAIAMGIGRFAFTPLLPLMQDDGLVGISEGGALASINFAGYWLGAVLAARMPFPPKTTLRVSLIAVGFSTLAMGLTENFYIWLFLRGLAGLCSAFTLVLVSNFYVIHLARIGRAEKQGWIFSGVGAGIILAGLGTLVIMAMGLGSAESWLIFGLVSLVAAGFVSLGVGDEISGAPADSRQQKADKSPLVWSIIIPYGALGIGYILPATYLPVMARDIISSPLAFGWAWPVFGTAALLSTLFAATLERRFSNRHIWTVSQIIMAVGLLFPVVWPHISTIIIAGICVGGTFMIITMMGMKEAHRLTPAHGVMRQISVMTAAFASGQIIGPLFASAIYSFTGSFSASLLLASLILAGSLIALRAGLF